MVSPNIPHYIYYKTYLLALIIENSAIVFRAFLQSIYGFIPVARKFPSPHTNRKKDKTKFLRDSNTSLVQRTEANVH